jgi:hypothetical protein
MLIKNKKRLGKQMNRGEYTDLSCKNFKIFVIDVAFSGKWSLTSQSFRSPGCAQWLPAFHRVQYGDGGE